MLALLAVSDAWFLDFNKSGGKKEKLGKSTPTPRKVVLVAKTVYVPVFASGDDSVPIADRLSPIAPVQAVGAVMADNGRQQGAFDYSSMYLQPPPTYVMYNAGSADVAAAYAAPVPADVYGAAGPQYVQYAAPPPQEVKHHYLISGWLIAPFYFFSLFKDLGDAVRDWRSWNSSCALLSYGQRGGGNRRPDGGANRSVHNCLTTLMARTSLLANFTLFFFVRLTSRSVKWLNRQDVINL